MAFNFPNHRLTLDGEDISDKVRSVTVKFDPHSTVAMTVELVVISVEVRPDGMIVAKTK